ncbi:formimidoylglutamate deiminase [Saccharopolyspora phatthalungensis]|uniref:Formiminoglutamate deiminase n=1 Tax=Saccharopolyspora phatthalungensis TaxID=664693 RepID=A0A840Q961_9PSEU|nr:formimidoylglutamate deiminase [Saccharopolyspora phatthalungensis]MBB5155218.1 formiminoglutamate deiminase [Saccharopolyspora phatthalungensis]
MNTYWCDWAWLRNGPAQGVLFEVDGGRITAVGFTRTPPEQAERLPGMTLPGLANAHSHAFHRALRGWHPGARGTFWTWRDQMYEVAAVLDPDSYYRLARGVYAEMALAGITCVGEFHYLHHAPDGARYDDPNAMSQALAQAALDVGIRITLLDTCYLAGGFGQSLDGVQLRFSDHAATDWADRIERFTVDGDRVRIGAALHSVRAVPAEEIPEVTGWARKNKAPLHLHLSEQRAENEACLAAHGCTPTQLLESRGALGADVTAVHATHLAASDAALLGGSGTGVCLCPTTEADLADGIGPAAVLSVAGSPLSIGSDGHSVIDPLAEVQSVESYLRLATETRGHFAAEELLAMATTAGHRSLGWSDAGWLGVGARADFVAVDLGSTRLAGVAPEAVPAVARVDDVRGVVADGRRIVQHGKHHSIDAARELQDAITALRA